MEDGKSLGNTIGMNRQLTINTIMNLEKLYDQIPYLKKVNERFKKAVKRVPKKSNTSSKKEKEESIKGKDAKAKDAKELAEEKKEREDGNKVSLHPSHDNDDEPKKVKGVKM